MAFALVVALAVVPHAPAASGACLDSAKSVPMNLGIGGRETDVVRIQKIVWSARRHDEIIGYLYTLANGQTWAGTRRSANMSDAGVRRFDRFLRAVAVRRSDLPASSTQNGAAAQYEVRAVPQHLAQFELVLSPCVEWPKDRPLP